MRLFQSVEITPIYSTAIHYDMKTMMNTKFHNSSNFEFNFISYIIVDFRKVLKFLSDWITSVRLYSHKKPDKTFRHVRRVNSHTFASKIMYTVCTYLHMK